MSLPVDEMRTLSQYNVNQQGLRRGMQKGANVRQYLSSYWITNAASVVSLIQSYGEDSSSCSGCILNRQKPVSVVPFEQAITST